MNGSIFYHVDTDHFDTQRFIFKENHMNWDEIAGNWKQLSGKAQQQWGKLTNDDLDVIDGKREELIGKVQARYGISKEEAQKQVDDFSKGCGC